MNQLLNLLIKNLLSKYNKKINPREKFEAYYNFDLTEIARVAKKIGLDYLL
jgi:hypothetical protein